MPVVIAETSTSTWNYHLREVVGGVLYLTGGAPAALCGRQLGWDTLLPLKAWGVKDHMPSKWCLVCQAIAEDRGFIEQTKENQSERND